MSSTALAVVIIVVALGFDYTNGFHDAGNAIATSISTRALTPRVALAMAAVMNVVGALISTKVAATIGGGIIDAPDGRSGLIIVLAALLGAISWNLLTWWLGLPSSSSHALIGGLIGAALASSETVKWSGVLDKVVVPMVVSPLIGFVFSYLFMLALLWAFRRVNAIKVTRGFRWGQIASGATMAFGHGTQDAQKTMGVIALTLVVSGHLDKSEGIPDWVILASAAAISLGTYSGGWRVMRTLGRRIFSLTPVSGFASQTVASAVMLGTAAYGLPVSTTHVISASVMGVGATRRLSAVRWGVAGNIIVAWILTIPAAGAVAALMWAILDPLMDRTAPDRRRHRPWAAQPTWVMVRRYALPNDEDGRMLPTFVIGLREGLEAALIVGIIAAFLRKQGRRDLLRWVWLGVGVAIVLCVAAGIALDVLSQDLPQRQQEGLETIIGLLAVAMVTYMVVWMKRNSRNLKGHLEGLAADAMGGTSGAGRAMIVMAFLAVLREGIETVVFLLAAFQTSTSGSDAAIGAVLGIVVAIGLGYGIYRGGVRINLSRFFRATGLVLVFVAAGILVNAVHTAHEAGWLNIGQTRTVDLTWLVDPGSVQSSLLTGMLGLQSEPVVIEVIAWLVYLVPVGIYVAWPPGRSLARRSVSRVLLASGAALVLATVVLAVVAPAPPGLRPRTAGAQVVSMSAAAVTVRDGARTETLQLSGSTSRGGVALQVYSLARTSRPAVTLPATLDVAWIAGLNGGRLPIGLSAPSGTAPAHYTNQIRLRAWIEPRTERIVEFESNEQVNVRVADPAGGTFALSDPIATSGSATPASDVRAATAAASADLATLQRRSLLHGLAWMFGILGGLLLLAGLALALSPRARQEVAVPDRTSVSDLVKS